MIERFKMIASGYLVLIKDDKVLLARRLNTGYMDGFYGLPAGHIEDGESLTTGTAREALEEIGLELQPSSLKLAHTMHRRGEDIRMDFFFTATTWLGEPQNEEPTKCDDLAWFPLNELPTKTIPYIRSALEQIQQGHIFSEFGW